ncbi:MAG: PEP-utilizing enzyme [Candidatus Moraniibacteriota bacterium]
MSFYQEEEIELQGTTNIKAHQQKYFWLRNSYSGVECLDYEFFEKRKAKLEPSLSEKNAERIKKIQATKVAIIRKFKISKTILEIAKRIIDAMEWQDERKREIWILQHYKQILLDEVSKRMKRKDLKRFGLWELAEILKGANLVRQEKFGFLLDEACLTEINENEVEALWNVYMKENLNDSMVIHGVIANGGVAIGKVKIVRDPKNEKKLFNEGDILVAPMTSPDYIFLMKKSAAVVTDTGGLTSHAAIVSRELEKPCIIGTKIATQVLHDGDLVEVDADNGVVRILERANEIKQKISKQNELKLISVNKNTPEDKKQVIELVKGTDWDVQRFNAYPFFTSSVATFSGFKLPWGLSYKHFLCVSHSKNVQWHYDRSDYERIGNIFWGKVTSIEILEELIAQYEKTYADSIRDARYLETDLQTASVEELKDLLRKQINLLCFSVGYAHITECASFVAEKYFQEKYQMEIKTVSASKQSFINRAASWAKKLCDSEMNDAEILKEFKKKYAWVQSSYLGRNEVDIKAVRNFAENFQEETPYVEDKSNVFVGILARLISWHDERKENILKSVYQSDPVLMALAKGVGISQEVIKFMLPEEIDKIEDKNFQAELIERSKLFIDYAPSTLERTLFIGDEAKDFLNAIAVGKESIVQLVKRVDWDVQGFNAYPFFISSVGNLSSAHLSWGLAYKHIFAIFKDKNVKWHYDKADFNRLGKIFWEKIKTVDDLEALISQYEIKFEHSSASASYDERVLNGYSIKEIKKLLNKQIIRLCDSAGIGHILESAAYFAEKEILGKYEINIRDIKEARQSFIGSAASFAGKLCNSNMNENQILEEFRKNYAWVKSSYLGRNEVDIKTIRELATQFKEGKEEVLEVSDVYVKIISRMISWQDERKENILKSIYQSEPVLMALAKKVGISQEAIKFMLPEEVAKIEDKKFQAVLAEREKLFIVYTPNTLKRTLFAGNAAQKMLGDLENKASVHEQEIKGSVAFSGVVSGVARVCLSMQSIEDFKKGEILVASMTRPEYISAMKKALAIVTDEGGITCHAAIIARELKIPCVIGTKIATQVLKDGDLVEVDANEGMVRKILL